MKTSENKDFFMRVYQVVALIPPGRVTTYGAIAKYLGTPKSARMVGWAMNNIHRFNRRLPAHRVVNRNGMLTGKHHFETPFLMQELLEKEGIAVKNDQIVRFKEVFWDPNIELSL
ncbi:MAG: MGMT family protein [Bacteroidetes bacterium]|nr:MAG: MGMT family protein [Bacteroidota bacterium]